MQIEFLVWNFLRRRLLFSVYYLWLSRGKVRLSGKRQGHPFRMVHGVHLFLEKQMFSSCWRILGESLFQSLSDWEILCCKKCEIKSRTDAYLCVVLLEIENLIISIYFVSSCSFIQCKLPESQIIIWSRDYKKQIYVVCQIHNGKPYLPEKLAN